MLRGAGRERTKTFVRHKEVRRGRERTAQRAAELVLTEDGAWQGGHGEETGGVGGFVAEKLEKVSVKGLAAWLGDNVDHSAAGLRELGGRQRALNPELGHRLHE